jgi:hypothetical protein
LPSLDLAGIDWVIVGGASRPDFRPLDLGWVRELRDRCVSMRIPLFFKQIGGLTPKAGGRLLDDRTWDLLLAAALSGIGAAAFYEGESAALIGDHRRGRPHAVGCSGERSPTVAACSSIPLMGPLIRERSERLNHRARRSFASRERPGCRLRALAADDLVTQTVYLSPASVSSEGPAG